jgi:hypothetical protein
LVLKNPRAEGRMIFPITLINLMIWLAGTAIILLLTSELVTTLEFASRILIDKKRLRIAAIGVGLAFLVTVVLRFL